MIKKKTRSGLL